MRTSIHEFTPQNGCNGLSWAGLNLGARNLLWVSHKGTEVKVLGYPPLLTQAIKRRVIKVGVAGTKTNAQMRYQCHRRRISLPLAITLSS